MSSSRLTMVAGTASYMAALFVVLYIVFDSYKNGKVIPDLSWLLVAASGGAVGGVGAYASNKYFSRDYINSGAAPALDDADGEEGQDGDRISDGGDS